jgi:hypothetical protein
VTDATKETLLTVLKDYGFSVVVALGCFWVLRQDVLLPLVQEHREFVKSLSETQREISQAIGEQTRLLYALQPRAGEMPQEN